MAITAAQLRALSPRASASIVDGIVANQKFLVEAGITTQLRIQHFFAQVANETGGFARLEENLNYTAARICKVWPARFKTIAAAQPYANNPAALAEKVYGGRLGNNKRGDGWTYRGSGLLQSTGKANFAEVGRATGLPVVTQPDLLRTFPGALQAACIYWDNRRINKLADADDVEAVTKAVNGGLIGLADRKAWLAKAKKIAWGGAQKPASAGQAARPAQPAQPAPLLAIVPKPTPVPTPVADKELIQRVQTGLKLLNYNPGSADGIIGPLTAGAIRIFRSDNGLPEGDFIDDELTAALVTAKPREMVAARANATTAQVAAVVPEAQVHWWNKIGAAVVGGGAAAGGAVDYIAPATGYLQPVRDFLGDIPAGVWIVGIIGVAAALYLGSQYGANKARDAYQSGDRR